MRRSLTACALGLAFASAMGTGCSDDSGNGDGARGGSGSGGRGPGAGRGGTGGGAGFGDAGESGSGTGEGGSPAGGMGGGESGSGNESGSGGLPPVLPFECDTRDVDGATIVDASIDADATWSDVVYVTGPISINEGATLTIEPGTAIVMAADSALELGAVTAATLIADGSAEAPIRFCGEEGKAGYWGGISFGENAAAESLLRNVLVADAGGSEAAIAIEAAVQVDNLQVRNSAADGVHAADFAPGSERLTVEGAAENAVVLTDAAAVTAFPEASAFSDNGDDAVHLRFTEVLSDTVFSALSVPYVQEAPVDVRGADVTFEAGVEYHFAAAADLDIGAVGSTSGLFVNGSEAAPVVFRGVDATAGSWSGIILRATARAASVLAHTEIRHAGLNGSRALFVQAAVTLQDVLIDESSRGAFIDTQGLDPASENLSITGTDRNPLEVLPNALVTVPEGGLYTGNGMDEILVRNGSFTVAGTVPNLGAPYVIEGIDILDGGSMTIAPGTRFLMRAGATIEVGESATQGTLIADGTASAPIEFAGVVEAPGYWGGIHVLPPALPSTRFDFVHVAHGAAACLTLRQPVNVTNSSFSNCSGFGVLKASTDPSNYTTTNVFTDNGSGGIGNLP